MVLDDDNPWNGILDLTVFALRATVHTTTQYTPAHLDFGWDSILHWHHDVDWEAVKKRKQDLINKGNVQKNKKLRTHAYQTWNKVLLRNGWKTKFNQNAYLGPYVIKTIRNNGTVRACKGYVIDTFNIWNLTPYNE